MDEDAADERSASNSSGESLRRLEFAVSGMTCDHCAETVARTLRQLPGVRKAEVNLKKGRAMVTGEGLDPERLTAAVNDLGYGVRFDL